MVEKLTHLIINWIEVDHHIILVGATDNIHWNLEKEFGGSGADAKSSVWVTLEENGKGRSVSEEAHFFCFPGDPARSLAMSHVFNLFKIIVEIEYPDATLINIESSGLILFTFWKKTKIEIKYDEKILEKKEIEDQVNSILET